MSSKTRLASGQNYDESFWENITDRPPAAPNSKDDEFNDAILASKWSWRNQGSATVVEKYGWLEFNYPAETAGQARLIEQTVSGTFTVTVKLFGSIALANFNSFGIWLTNNSNSRAEAVIHQFDSNFLGSPYIDWFTWTHPGTFNSRRIRIVALPWYIRVTVTSTNILVYYSFDGLSWVTFGSTTLSDWITTVDRVGIGGHTSANQAATHVVNWFRIT